VLDTLPEQAYDDIVEAASALMDVPISAISLVDEDRQWFKAKIGTDACETSRDTAVCAHTILQASPLVVPDATLDPRFCDNSLVTGPFGLRFYAGAPIVVDGEAVGSLCCIDQVPRTVTERQIRALSALARQVAALLVSRLERERLEQTERRFEAFFGNAPAALFLKDQEGRMQYVNHQLESIFGRSSQELLGLTDWDWLPHDSAAGFEMDDRRVRETGETLVIEERIPLEDGGHRIWQTLKFPVEMQGETWLGGFAFDITQLRDSEAKIQEQSEQLKLALEEAETATMSARIAADRFSQLFGGLPVACFTYDAEGTIHEWNEAAEKLWGVGAEEALLSSIYETVVGVHNRTLKERIVQRVFAGETVYGEERRETMRDGRDVWLLSSTFPLRTPSGAIVGAVSANVDVTERKRMEEAIRESESRLRTVLDSLHEGVVVQDAEGKVHLWNRSAERILGISGEQLNLKSKDDPRRHATREDGSDFPVEERPFAVAIRENRREEACLSYQRPESGQRWLRLIATPLPRPNGERPSAAVVSFMDVTEERIAEQTLRESETRFRTVLESLQEGVMLYDVNDGVVLWNASATRLLGIESDDLRGQRPSDWKMVRPDGTDYPAERSPLLRALVTGKAQSPTRVGIRQSEGEYQWMNTSIAPLLTSNGKRPSAVVISFLDETERVRQEQRIAAQIEQIQRYSSELESQKHQLQRANSQLESLATTDGLTGVKNHRFFQEFLRRKVSQSQAIGMPLSVILVDVDHFKTYNDDYGHQEGDNVLRAVAQTLHGAVRGQDMVARYGGEEFVIVMPGTADQEAAIVADRIRAKLAAQDHCCRKVTASFGVASFGPGLTEAEALVRAADEALYQSKEAGRNRVTVWEAPTAMMAQA
jgi:diguanylate cyclase (GGDEF)-like protein/PAS domain S-box-containing protein